MAQGLSRRSTHGTEREGLLCIYLEFAVQFMSATVLKIGSQKAKQLTKICSLMGGGATMVSGTYPGLDGEIKGWKQMDSVSPALERLFGAFAAANLVYKSIFSVAIGGEIQQRPCPLRIRICSSVSQWESSSRGPARPLCSSNRAQLQHRAVYRRYSARGAPGIR